MLALTLCFILATKSRGTTATSSDIKTTVMYGHVVLPLFTKRWRISGSRGSKIPWYCEDTGREMWSLIFDVGDTPGVKIAKSKTTMTSVLHLAMHEDPITKIFLHLSFHYLLSAEGSFSVGKLLNTQGEQSRYLCQCHGGKIMQLMYPGQPAGCVRSSTVLWNLLAASTASNTRAQISCVLLSLHSWHEHAIKSCSPQGCLSIPELGDSKCHWRKAQGLWWVIILGNKVWGCADCGLRVNVTVLLCACM